MNKESIFQAATPKTETIEIPEFQHDGRPLSFTIREFSSTEASWLVDQDEKDPENAPARWISRAVIEVNGTPQDFAEEDIPKIGGWGARGTKRLHDAILKLNGLGGQAAKN